MDTYKVYLYKCDPTNITGDIATALWALLVQLPFNLFSFILELLVYVLKVLDLGTLLQKLQSTMIDTSKGVFLSLIGKQNGVIGSTSFVGLAVLLMAGYLLYQFTNGKGRFLSSLCQFGLVFALVFFYFGSFSGNGVKSSGGEVLFSTVQNVTNTAQSDITGALNPTLGKTDPTTVFTTELKETANYMNTGNVDGKLSDGSTFDYGKAAGSDGDSYISALGQTDAYLQANNDVLIQKITFGVSATCNAYLMVLPLAVVEVLISVLALVLLVLILLFPLTAALSFFPFFRNAAVNGLKKMMMLVALPAGLSIVLAIVLYLLTQVDKPVLLAVSAAHIPAAFSFLVTLIVELALKIALLYFLWRYRNFILDFLTGGVVNDKGLGSAIESAWSQAVGSLPKLGEKATGTLLLTAGAAFMAGGGIGAAAGAVAANDSLQSGSEKGLQKGISIFGEGLNHFVPESLQQSIQSFKERQEEQSADVPAKKERAEGRDVPAKSPQTVSETVPTETKPAETLPAQTFEASSETLSSLSKEPPSPKEKAQSKAIFDPSLVSEEPAEQLESNPFVFRESKDEKPSWRKKRGTQKDPQQTLQPSDQLALSPLSLRNDSPIIEEETTGAWEGAIQDLNAARKEARS